VTAELVGLGGTCLRSRGGSGTPLLARLLDSDEAGAELATIGRLARPWRL